MPLLSRLERAALLAARALSAIGLAALMVLAFMTLANGLMRWALNQPIAGVVDVGGLAIAIAVACCMPVALIERGHIGFRVAASLSPRLGRAFDVFAALVVFVVLVLMALQFRAYAESLVQSGETTYVFKLPVAPFWYAVDAILWIAAAVQAIVVALDTARLFGRGAG